MKELGERLRILRESVKLSQVKMADLLGVKQSSINRYEQGQSAPSLETLVKYADYFDESILRLNDAGAQGQTQRFSRIAFPVCE